MRKVKLAVFFLFILSAFTSNLVFASIESNPPVNPGYVAGELIVKFKNQSDIDTVKSYLQNPNLQSSSPLVQVSRQYNLQSMSRVFADGPTSEELKTKFPQRGYTQNFSLPDMSKDYVLRFPVTTNIISLIAAYSQIRESVEYASTNNIATTQAIPSDTYVDPDPDDDIWSITWGRTSGYQEDMWGLKRIGMEQAWGITHGSSDVYIAVVDTGLDYNHIDIQGNIWTNPGEIPNNGIDDDGNGYVDDYYGFDFANSKDNNEDGDYNDPGEISDADPIDDNGHGSHVSGTIAAKTDNHEGVAGISWNSKIMAVKVMSAAGFGDDVDISRGIYYAVNNGAQIINMSLGGNVYFPELTTAVDYAYANRVTVVASAGNDAADAYYYTPAGLPHVVCTAAWGYDDKRSAWKTDRGTRYPNYGDVLDLTAPGSDIVSLRAYGTSIGILAGQNYTRLNGTSMASPHTAGVAALLLSLNPSLSPDLVQAILHASAEDVSKDGLIHDGKDIYTGYGLIDAYSAVIKAREGKEHAYRELLVPETNLACAMIISGTQIEVKAAIENASQEIANNIFCRIYAGSSETGTKIDEFTIPSLGANEVYNLDKVFSFVTLPDKVTLQINPYDSVKNPNPIPEYNTNNNEVAINLSISSLSNWPVNIGADVYSSAAVADLDPAYPGAEIITGCEDGYVYAWHSDGTPVPGWPQSSDDLTGFRSSPAVADIDGDGRLEVIISSYDAGKVYAWHSDGTPVPGWPQETNSDFLESSPAVADLNGDGKLEVIMGSTNGMVYVWQANGNFLPGWPKSTIGASSCYPCVADLDQDGALEVIAASIDYNVYVWRANGNGFINSDGFFASTGNGIVSVPAVADIDKNFPGLEIIIGSKDNNVYIWHKDGTLVSGWPQTAGGMVNYSPVVGDVDNDGEFEIIASSGNQIFIWKNNGNLLPGWPQAIYTSNLSSLVIADLDGDSSLEIMSVAKGKMYAWHYNDRNGDNQPDSVAGWPLRLESEWTYSSPVVADLNGDGKLEVILGSGLIGVNGLGKVSIWTLPWKVSNRMPWPKFHRDLKNSGLYNDKTVLLSGWPQTINHTAWSSPTLADVDPGYHGMEVISGSYEDNKLYIWHADGTPVVGWPQLTDGNVYFSPSLAADLDANHLGLEVAAGTGCGYFYAWYADGNQMPNWPKNPFPATVRGAPAVADLDGDGSLEIVQGYDDGKVYAWRVNGDLLAGWPKDTGQGLRYSWVGSIAVADLDPLYPGLETVALSNGQDNFWQPIYQIFIWHADGTLVSGWPKSIDNMVDFSAPAIADLDNDGGLEIIFGSTNLQNPQNSKLYAFHNDGNVVSGWPQTTLGHIYSSPAVVDLDYSTPGLEIVTADFTGNVYAWHKDGTLVSGWPKTTGGEIYSSPAIADLDGDGTSEVIVASNDNKIYAWHSDGTLVLDWPKDLGNPFSGLFSPSPSVADLDGNGTLEVVMGWSDGKMYAWTLPWETSQRAPWPMFHKNRQRTGSNAAPNLNYVASRSAYAGSALTFNLNPQDPDNDALTCRVTGLPQGATFDSATGNFSWTPTSLQLGKYNLTFTATDIYGKSTSEVIEITVKTKTDGNNKGSGSKDKNIQ